MAELDPQKRVARLRQAKPRRQPSSREAGRVPPGQYVTQKFPVLTFGDTPDIDLSTWELRVWGLVDQPLTLSWQQLQALSHKTIQADIHCVTRWSLLDTTWEGVPFATIVEMARPLPEARVVMQHAYGGYTTNLPLQDLLEADVLLADHFNGAPLERDHGGPLRMVVPKLYFWKSAKWLSGLEFLPADHPGFWEQYGYHMHGDPWQEERFGKR